MKPQSIIPTAERLDADHQLATLRNTDPVQTHIVIDRFQQGHELAAGQRAEIDMLVADIKYFQRQRRPNRIGNNGQLLKPHPILVEDCRAAPEDVAPAHSDEEVEAAQATTHRQRLR